MIRVMTARVSFDGEKAVPNSSGRVSDRRGESWLVRIVYDHGLAASRAGVQKVLLIAFCALLILAIVILLLFDGGGTSEGNYEAFKKANPKLFIDHESI